MIKKKWRWILIAVLSVIACVITGVILLPKVPVFKGLHNNLVSVAGIKRESKGNYDIILEDGRKIELARNGELVLDTFTRYDKDNKNTLSNFSDFIYTSRIIGIKVAVKDKTNLIFERDEEKQPIIKDVPISLVVSEDEITASVDPSRAISDSIYIDFKNNKSDIKKIEGAERFSLPSGKNRELKIKTPENKEQVYATLSSITDTLNNAYGIHDIFKEVRE